MAFGLVAAIIGGAASIGGALLSGDAAENAADTAAGAQRDASSANIALQKEAFANAKTQLSPYAKAGDKAQGYLDALTYGSGSYGATPVPAAGTDGAPGSPDWQGYLTQEPDVAAWASAHGYDPIAFAKQHWTTYGQAEGRTLPTVAADGGTAGAPSAQGTPVTYGEAMAALQNSPLYAQNEQDYTARKGIDQEALDAWTNEQKIQDELAYKRAASVNGVGGQTGKLAKTFADTANNYAALRAQYAAANKGATYDKYSSGRAGATGAYTGQLNDNASRGYNASTGIASGGANYASLSAQQNTNAANAISSNAITQGNVSARTYGAIANTIGSGAQQVYNNYAKSGGVTQKAPTYGDYNAPQTNMYSGYYQPQPIRNF